LVAGTLKHFEAKVLYFKYENTEGLEYQKNSPKGVLFHEPRTPFIAPYPQHVLAYHLIGVECYWNTTPRFELVAQKEFIC
jgi:hypothetical protein